MLVRVADWGSTICFFLLLSMVLYNKGHWIKIYPHCDGLIVQLE